MEPWIPKPWMLPLLVAALVVPAFAAFAIGGTAAGTSVGALTIASLIVLAARSRHRTPISFDGAEAGVPIAVLVLAPIEELHAASRLAALADTRAGEAEPGRQQLLLLVPARARALQRWLSDTDSARLEAQERLAISLATLAAAGVRAEGRIVDEDPLQAIEDISAQHAAARLVLMLPAGEESSLAHELRERLEQPLDVIEV